MLTPPEMTAFEVSVGMTVNTDPLAVPPRPRGQASPAEALREALLPALGRAPCVVAFSGGRDSSVVLAAAVAAARREGLPPPLPVTLRFPHAAESEESRWQELVVSHLELDDWIRIELSEELDFVGPVAREVLLDGGPLFPPNAHLMVAVAEHAAHGSIASGMGGDELFGLWFRRRLADVAARRSPPSWRDVARLAGELAPLSVRTEVLRRRQVNGRLPWLRSETQRELDEVHLSGQVHAPARWDRHVGRVACARSLRLAVPHLRRIAAARDAEFHLPLVAPEFVAALLREGGWRGFGGRTAAMHTLFGDELPPELLARRHKATFRDVFFCDETRRFAERWSGRGVDDSIVDPEALRGVWAGPSSDYRSAMLLQSAWLHDQGWEPG